uniref:Uncharacterized protein n=1 Tax=Setaria italica TaxID=4555 RepID=K3XYE4_SETIT
MLSANQSPQFLGFISSGKWKPVALEHSLMLLLLLLVYHNSSLKYLAAQSSHRIIQFQLQEETPQKRSQSSDLRLVLLRDGDGRGPLVGPRGGGGRRGRQHTVVRSLCPSFDGDDDAASAPASMDLLVSAGLIDLIDRSVAFALPLESSRADGCFDLGRCSSGSGLGQAREAAWGTAGGRRRECQATGRWARASGAGAPLRVGLDVRAVRGFFRVGEGGSFRIGTAWLAPWGPRRPPSASGGSGRASEQQRVTVTGAHHVSHMVAGPRAGRGGSTAPAHGKTQRRTCPTGAARWCTAAKPSARFRPRQTK